MEVIKIIIITKVVNIIKVISIIKEVLMVNLPFIASSLKPGQFLRKY